MIVALFAKGFAALMTSLTNVIILGAIVKDKDACVSWHLTRLRLHMFILNVPKALKYAPTAL